MSHVATPVVSSAEQDLSVSEMERLSWVEREEIERAAADYSSSEGVEVEINTEGLSSDEEETPKVENPVETPAEKPVEKRAPTKKKASIPEDVLLVAEFDDQRVEMVVSSRPHHELKRANSKGEPGKVFMYQVVKLTVNGEQINEAAVKSRKIFVFVAGREATMRMKLIDIGQPKCKGTCNGTSLCQFSQCQKLASPQACTVYTSSMKCMLEHPQFCPDSVRRIVEKVTSPREGRNASQPALSGGANQERTPRAPGGNPRGKAHTPRVPHVDLEKENARLKDEVAKWKQRAEALEAQVFSLRSAMVSLASNFQK